MPGQGDMGPWLKDIMLESYHEALTVLRGMHEVGNGFADPMRYGDHARVCKAVAKIKMVVQLGEHFGLLTDKKSQKELLRKTAGECSMAVERFDQVMEWANDIYQQFVGPVEELPFTFQE